jgi:subfamily B ATP-binding cassette protein MsbA
MSENKTTRTSYARLWREWLRPYKMVLFFTLFLMALVAGASAGYAKFIEWIIAAFETSNPTVIYWGPAGVIALTSIKGISQYFQNVIQTRVLTRVQVDMQTKMFSSLINMDLDNLQAESPAALASRFSADIALTKAAVMAVIGSISAVLTVIAVFAVMLSIDWAMTLGLILIFMLAFGPVGVVGARVRKLSDSTQKEIAQMTGAVNEGLGGVRMVRTYRLERRLEDASKTVFERLFTLQTGIAKWQASVSPLMEILGGLAVAALLFLVALRMSAGAIDLAGFIGLLTALGVATNPARKLGNSYTAALQGVAAIDRIFGLYDAENTIKDGSFTYPEGEIAKGNIDFEELSFAYPDGYKALQDITLQIPAGETYAFVGRSGAGKSTIFNLLPRLFNPTTGSLKLDGRETSDFTLSALRDQISVVSQDSVLLSGTILENIQFGRQGASLEDCIEAAKSAAAHDFISALPEGYDTVVDPTRAAFSGGEKQRISIARAILRNAPILLLDEPTSALDAASEAAIRDALDRLSEGRTTLVIAHRLSTILDADQIVVMDQGRIVDQGKHDELLQHGGIYADLYNLQFDMSPEVSAQPPRKRGAVARIQSPVISVLRFFGLADSDGPS